MLNKNKKIWRFLCCAVVSFSLTIYSTGLINNKALANNYNSTPLTKYSENNPSTLETKAQQAYQLADYQKAIALWQQALIIYEKNSQTIKKAQTINYLALAHYKLGQKEKAQLEIKKSRELLETITNNKDINQTLAQVLNNQGIIELGIGNTENAIACWDLAIATYQKLEDDLGVIRAQLNQARGFKSIGLYQRSLDSFTDLNNKLVNYSDSSLKLAVLRDYGNILRLIGEVEKSEIVLKESLAIATLLSLPKEKATTLLSLGKTLSVREEIADKSTYSQALNYYQQSINICNSFFNCLNSDLSLEINLAKLNLLVQTKYWKQETDLINTIQKQFSQLKINKNYLDLKLNFAHTLVTLKQQIAKLNDEPPKIFDWQQTIDLTDSIIIDSQNLNYAKAQSYGWLLKGQIQEILSQWNQAKDTTTKALAIAQTINATEVSYLCQWQLGRIERAKKNTEKAIAHYKQGIIILDSLSNEIANANNSIKNHFYNTVEPIYREQIALLLDTSPRNPASQENLTEARNTIESLQIAELNNFFREACFKGKSRSIDSVDKNAAAIYPIILPNSLELILSIPNQPLHHYSVAVSQAELEATIAQLRQTVVIRSRRTFYESATKLYSWLITPVTQQLAQYNIKTIVLIPDGALRNMPLSALYDGNHYLIEQYNLVLNPSLQLLSPRPLKDTSLKTLAVGLTKQKGDFAALDYVSQELAQIQTQVKSSVLIDEEFTTQALQEKIDNTDYPIVHIATHGQFGSSFDNTFLLAWNDRINLNQLHQILYSRATNQEAIELLVLSACETAKGDDEAALGLAGMAIRAGAKSTIATLWSINDRSTAQLMSVLYQKLTDKSIPKAEAIRQAQLSLLHDPQYEHPFYWAAYTIIGNWL